MCHYKNQICLKKIPTFLFYPGFYARVYDISFNKSDFINFCGNTISETHDTLFSWSFKEEPTY